MHSLHRRVAAYIIKARNNKNTNNKNLVCGSDPQAQKEKKKKKKRRKGRERLDGKLPSERLTKTVLIINAKLFCVRFHVRLRYLQNGLRYGKDSISDVSNTM